MVLGVVLGVILRRVVVLLCAILVSRYFSWGLIILFVYAY